MDFNLKQNAVTLVLLIVALAVYDRLVAPAIDKAIG
jgi:hypothetical protein